MMLPEHKLENIKYREGFKKRLRRNLDDQELQAIGECLAESMHTGRMVTVSMYDEWEFPQVIGIVERVDPYKQRFMVGGDWFYLSNVERAELE